MRRCRCVLSTNTAFNFLILQVPAEACLKTRSLCWILLNSGTLTGSSWLPRLVTADKILHSSSEGLHPRLTNADKLLYSLTHDRLSWLSDTAYRQTSLDGWLWRQFCRNRVLLRLISCINFYINCLIWTVARVLCCFKLNLQHMSRPFESE